MNHPRSTWRIQRSKECSWQETNSSKPNGSLGESVIRNLLKNDFKVTLLTRNPKETKQSFPDCNVVQADYDLSTERLAQTIKDETNSPQALVVLLNRDLVDAQIKLMDAATAAGIPHIVPSCFGVDTRNPAIRRLPIWDTKVRMEDYVLEKVEEGAFTFTGVQTGAFLDFALEKGVFLNVIGGLTPVFDGGDVPFSVSLTEDIGKAVSGVLMRPSEYKNRFVYMHSAVVTQNSLLEYAKALDPTREFKTIPLDTEVLEKKAWEQYHAGDRSTEVIRMFMPRVTFGLRLGKFENVDNEALGIKQSSEEELRQLISKYMSAK